MTDRTPVHDPGSEASAEVPREGTVYRGPGIRLRRAGRTAAIVGVLAFIALLSFLTTRYSHDLGPAPGERQEAASPLAAVPLTAERIEALARRRLEEELRAAKQPPGPPDLDLQAPAGASLDRAPAIPAPPPSAASGRPPVRKGPPRRPALRSPLRPPGSRSAPARAAPGVALPEPPQVPDLSVLHRAFDGQRGGGGGAPAPGGAAARGVLTAAPEPLDRRTLDSPSGETAALRRLPPPAAPTLYAGTAVPLVLSHEVATDVPGPVRAVVARDVFDSVSGRRLLIPRGSLVLGHQAAHAAAGDRRILLHWREIKLPSGASYRLPVLPAGSSDGTAGVLGEVDTHWWSRMGSAVALSLVGAGVQLSQPQDRTAVQGLAPSEGQVVGQQLGLELGRLSSEILRRGLHRPPTIHLRAGDRLTLLLTHDLAFLD